MDEHRDPSHPLPEPRHELFAQLLSDGMTQVGAYENAGYVPNEGNANVLAKRPAVAARVQYLIRRKAEDDGLTFAGRIVVDLDKVGPEAKKLSPEWFLYRVMLIAEDDGAQDEEGNSTGGGAKPADKLKALQLGAEWLGYFKDQKLGPMKTKDPNNEAEAVSSDRARRVAAGKASALSRYSSLVDGLGNPPEEHSQDRDEGSDPSERSGADEEDIAER